MKIALETILILALAAAGLAVCAYSVDGSRGVRDLAQVMGVRS